MPKIVVASHLGIGLEPLTLFDLRHALIFGWLPVYAAAPLAMHSSALRWLVLTWGISITCCYLAALTISLWRERLRPFNVNEVSGVHAECVAEVTGRTAEINRVLANSAPPDWRQNRFRVILSMRQQSALCVLILALLPALNLLFSASVIFLSGIAVTAVLLIVISHIMGQVEYVVTPGFLEVRSRWLARVSCVRVPISGALVNCNFVDGELVIESAQDTQIVVPLFELLRPYSFVRMVLSSIESHRLNYSSS